MKHPDLTVVNFETADSIKAIKTGSSLFSEGTLQFDKAYALGFLVFQSKDTAERVTAFKHAVHLCGGKPSAFGPTPSQS